MKGPLQQAPQPSLAVSLKDLYPDRFDVDDEDGYALEEEPILNLGAESIAPTPPPEPADGSYFPNYLPPTNKRRSRLPLDSSANQSCGICSNQAVEPSQTRCCGRIFCQDHLQDWLNTTSDHCPSCGSYCSTDTVIFPPSASPNMPYAAAPSSLRNASQADPDSFSASSDSSDDSDSAEGRTSDHNHLLSAFSLIKNTASSTMDPELAGGVLGKVLSIVALTLVFYVLNS